MKKRFLITTALLLITATLAIGYFTFNRYKSPKIQESEVLLVEEEVLEPITLTVDFGDGETITESIEGVSTAYELLEEVAKRKDFEIEVENYDFGVLVTSINGYEGALERAWIYFVNGETGEVAADQAEVSPGDTVEWKFIETS